MDITNKKGLLILKSTEETLSGFLNALQTDLLNFSDKNMILDTLAFGALVLEQKEMIMSISKTHKANKKSFVLVNAVVDTEEFPEEFSVVPTLHEAEDLIEMEEIQRDLGF